MKTMMAGVGFSILILGLGVFGFRSVAPRQLRIDVLKALKVFPFSNSDSPVVVRGGSFSGLTYSAQWYRESSNPDVWSADMSQTPDSLSLVYVDPNSQNMPQDEGPWAASTNWYILVRFQGNATPDLTICTQLASGKCTLSTSGTLGTKVFFQADVTDKMESSNNTSVDRGGQRLAFTSLAQCKSTGADDLDPKCDHIKSIELHGVHGHDGTYECVDGACEIEVEH